MVKAQERTKVVVRRLPPGLTEEGFLKVAGKLIDGKVNWTAYYQGKVSLRKLVFSRAYLNFVEPSDVFAFKAAFHGHTFVSTKGTQYKCSVEYAPFQKVPQPSKRRNPLEGTIEQDPDYQAFLKELEEGPALLPSAAKQREQQEKESAANGSNPSGVQSTPLMEYLKQKYQGNPSMRLGTGRRKQSAQQLKPVPETTQKGVSKRGDDSKAAKAAAALAVSGKSTTEPGAGKDRSKGGRERGAKAKEPVTVAAISEVVSAPKVLLGGVGGKQDSKQGGAVQQAKQKQAEASAGAAGRGRGVISDMKARGQSGGAGAGAPARAGSASVESSALEPRPAQAGGLIAGIKARGDQEARGTQRGTAAGSAKAGAAGASDAGQEQGQQGRQKDGQARGGKAGVQAGAAGGVGTAAATAATAALSKGRVAAGSAAAAPAASEAAPRAPRMLLSKAAGDSSTGTTAAASGAAGEGAASGADGGAAGGRVRKVRAGFQAYRPPTRNTDGDGG